jgi:hypothetical protein
MRRGGAPLARILQLASTFLLLANACEGEGTDHPEQPLVLATSVKPNQLALNKHTLCWSAWHLWTLGRTEQAIFCLGLARAGENDAFKLTDVLSRFSDLVLDEDNVYWSDNDHRDIDLATGSVMRRPLPDGPNETLSTQSPGTSVVGDLMVLDGHLYYRGGSLLRRVPVQGGPAEDLVTMAGPSIWFTSHGDHIYWVERGGAGRSIRRLDTGTRQTETIVEDTVIGPLSADDRNVYWTKGGATLGEDVIMKKSLSGGPAEVLVGGQKDPFFHVSDGRFLYWAERLTQKIWKVPIDGGQPILLTHYGRHPSHLVIDDQFVYWGDLMTGELLRLPR